MVKHQVQQWKKNGKYWKDVQSFDNADDAREYAKTVKNSRVVVFNK